MADTFSIFFNCINLVELKTNMQPCMDTLEKPRPEIIACVETVAENTVAGFTAYKYLSGHSQVYL